MPGPLMVTGSTIAFVAWLGRNFTTLSREKAQNERAKPRIGSTIQAKPMPMSSAATMLGMRMPMPSPMSAQSASASRLSASDRSTSVDGKGSTPRALSTTAPTLTEPSRLTRP